MKTLLLHNWHAGRILRAVLSLGILVLGIAEQDSLIMAFGGVFLLMALLNVAPPCCAGTACAPRQNNTRTGGPVHFEEVTTAENK